MSRAFGWIGIVLFLVTLWGFWTEYNREWKGYQRGFRRLLAERTQKELQEARDRLSGPELEKARAALEQAVTIKKENQEDYDEGVKERKAARHIFFKEDRKRQFIKSRLDAALYRYEHEVKSGRAGEFEKGAVEELKRELSEQEERAAGLEKIKDQAEARVEHYDSPVDAAQADIGRLEADVRRLEKKLRQTQAQALVFPRGLEIKQFNLEELGRVDRCMTCHMGADQPGLEDAPPPFATHPQFKTLLASHPPEKFGCTSCHGGQGWATTREAAHGRVEFWHEPLLDGKFIETRCLQCHSGVTQLEGAPVVMKGRQLFEQYGCWGCHQIEGFKPLEEHRVGPKLVSLGSKTSQKWLEAWIRDPKTVRPKTRMPAFRFAEGEVEAISAYLASLRDDTIGPGYAAAEKELGHLSQYLAEGQELVGKLNCAGCHKVGAEGDVYAPELTLIGDKTRPEWIYQWLKDPKKLQPHTHMPDFRLTDREAFVITEYLASLKGQGVRAGLQGGVQQGGGEPQETLIARGKELIASKGCMACHEVEGIEQKLIIPPLTGLADKHIHELEFGYTRPEEVPRTVYDWVRHKINKPGVFDTERIFANMPTFNLDDSEVEALLTYLMTLTEHGLPESSRSPLTERERAIELGRQIVREHNCTACHKIEGVGSDVAPDLAGEGKKVRQDWLFHFLKEPRTLRPWLDARMPNFGFDDKEVTGLVAYFAALDGEPYPYESFETPAPTEEGLEAGKQLFEMFKCLACHVAGEVPEGVPTENLAPDLTQVKHRLKPEWVKAWLEDPQKIQPGTRMPTNWPYIMGRYYVPPPAKDILGGDVALQIQAVRDYLMVFEGVEEEPEPLPEPAVVPAEGEATQAEPVQEPVFETQ
ncbi:MAG: c-type cytochrome [Candidatus Omnitrophica bacterium]|nr:c-type cytochrome [Candidatus Omnitrophota bacterium]